MLLGFAKGSFALGLLGFGLGAVAFWGAPQAQLLSGGLACALGLGLLGGLAGGILGLNDRQKRSR
jgi:hypothetical protein